MELVSKEHKIIRFAFMHKKEIENIIVKDDSWRTPLEDGNHRHEMHYLFQRAYGAHVRMGTDLSQRTRWTRFVLRDNLWDDQNCFYCSVLECNPEIELQDIFATIHETDGTIRQRIQRAYERLCCGVVMKPAKQ